MAQKTNKLPKIVYTVEEENWLIINVLEFRDIVENKKTDGVTKLEKDWAWERITRAFNVAPPNQERSLKSLREKYQKIKQVLKNRVFHFSKDAKQTGGGPPKPELPPLSEPMQELFNMLIPSTYGLLAANGDSDEIPSKANSSSQHIEFNDVATPAFEVTIEDQVFVFENDVAGEADLDNGQPMCINTPERSEKSTVNPEPKANGHTWERVNPSKLRKAPNPLLQNKRRKYKRDEEKYCEISKERLQHLKAKHAIEMEILQSERERFNLERQRAACEVERAEFERARAEFDRDRTLVELQRSKNQLEYDRELHLLHLSNMQNVPLERQQTSASTAASRKQYFLKMFFI